MAEARLQSWTTQIQNIKDLFSAQEIIIAFYSQPDSATLHPYYDAYLGSCNETILIEGWIHEHSRREVAQKLKMQFPADTEICLLTIGCGRGTYDIELLKQMSREFGHLTITAVEPTNQASVLNQSITDELKDVRFTWAQETLADYRSGPRGGQKYHVIIAIHSLYYVGDLEENLAYLLSSIEEGGFLIIVLGAESTIFTKLWLDKPWLGIASFAETSQRARRLVVQAGYQVETINLPAKIDVASVFDERSEEGAALLDILTCVPQSRKVLPGDIKSDILNYLREANTCKEADDGQILMNMDQDLLIIKKELK